MTELTHERVSELLGPYSTGRLDPTMRADVDTHLATCADCTLELAGMKVLQAGEAEQMTGPEREELTSAVRAAVLGSPRPRWSERWSRRAAPALGVAAMLTLAVVGYVSFQGDSASDAPAESSIESGPGGDADTGTRAADEVAPEADTFGAAEGAGGSTGTSTESLDMQAGAPAAQKGQIAAPIPVVVEDRFASASLTSELSAPRDARGRRRNFAFDAAAPALFAAPDPAIATLADTCARTIIETSPHPSLTPTYAAHFPTDDILVIGFVWRDESTGALNFELRGWRGDSCDRVSPIYRSGPV